MSVQKEVQCDDFDTERAVLVRRARNRKPLSADGDVYHGTRRPSCLSVGQAYPNTLQTVEECDEVTTSNYRTVRGCRFKASNHYHNSSPQQNDV